MKRLQNMNPYEHAVAHQRFLDNTPRCRVLMLKHHGPLRQHEEETVSAPTAFDWERRGIVKILEQLAPVGVVEQSTPTEQDVIAAFAAALAEEVRVLQNPSSDPTQLVHLQADFQNKRTLFLAGQSG